MKKALSILLVLLLVAAMLTGCGKTAPSSDANKQDTPAADTAKPAENDKETEKTEPAPSEESEPEAEERPTEIVVCAGAGSQLTSGNFDPLQGFMVQGFFLLHSPLLRYDMDLNKVNDLATGDYEVSEDGLEYTFKIREDALFADGSPVTASDVAFTYMKMKDAGTDIDVSLLDHADVIDDHTVRFVLSQPQSTFLDQVALIGIVPEALYDENYAAKGIGSGPWKVVQCDVEQQTIVVPNEYYYGEKPYFTKVTFVSMDEQAAIAALKAGQLDVSDISSEFALEQIDGMHLVTVDTVDVRMMTLPTVPEQTREDGTVIGNNVTCDPVIRQALNIGISREQIISDAYNSFGKPGTGLIGKYAVDSSFEDGRVEEAKKMLDDAGWVDTDGDGIREKDGLKAEFDVYAMSVQMERYYCALSAANQARELGIQINCYAEESSVIREKKWTSGIIYSLGEYTAQQVKTWYYTGTRMNCASYSNPDVDAAIDAAIAATSVEEANANWNKAEELAYPDVPYMYLVNMEHCIFIRDGLDIGQQIPNPHGHGAPIIGTMNQWKWAD